MTNHTGKYGTGKPFSSFSNLRSRTEFPPEVHSFMQMESSVTGMTRFCDVSTLLFLVKRAKDYGNNNDNKRMKKAVHVWACAVLARSDIPANQPGKRAHTVATTILENGLMAALASFGQTTKNSMENDMEEETQEVRVNAERNEMVALLQGSKGAQFVRVQMQHSRLDEHDKHNNRNVGPQLTYKAIDLNLEVGEYVIVQYRDRLGIGVVNKVFEDVPTSDEYDYNTQMRHMVQKIDVDRAKQLTLLDRNILRKITGSEAQSRMERLMRHMGGQIDTITLELPALTK